MKRGRDSLDGCVAAAELPDSLYEDVRKIIAEQQQQLTANLTDPMPPVPLKGIAHAYVTMAESFREAVQEGKREDAFHVYACGDTHEFSRNAPFGNKSKVAKWWDRVIGWEAAMDERTEFMKQMGTGAQVEAFKERVFECHSEFCAAIAEGWHTLHPKVPGHWDDDRTFVICYE